MAMIEKIGRVILAGGEVLLPQVRESVLYPAITRLVDRYRGVGGVKVIVQTTGDLVTRSIVDELLSRGVWMISVSGMDDFHEGFTVERREVLRRELTAMFQEAGMQPSEKVPGEPSRREDEGPVYGFFGATPESWIGRIWPRGRAWLNGLSRAGLADNFCNAWSGGLNFLNLGLAGSEVAIDPAGNVSPCCMKTRVPLGNLVEGPLMEILQSLVGNPAFEAISMGHPEWMGIARGWSPDRFFERSRTTTPRGEPYQNLCTGCDRFHEEVLGPEIRAIRDQRFGRVPAAAGR